MRGPDLVLLLETTANVILFLPLGAALHLRGVGPRGAAGLALLTSVVVESAQHFLISGRTTSFDDVLLNVVGAIVGYAVAARWLSAPDEPGA